MIFQHLIYEVWISNQCPSERAHKQCVVFFIYLLMWFQSESKANKKINNGENPKKEEIWPHFNKESFISFTHTKYDSPTSLKSMQMTNKYSSTKRNFWDLIKYLFQVFFFFLKNKF